MEDIKVSIIMPVYNSGQYLRPAVDSILSQSMKEFELILVDDGSSDGSEKVCDEYAQAHPEGTFPIVRVIHQENGGICKARNVALSEARGEYIGFCDHDDIYLPGLIETAYTKAKQYDADIVKYGEQDMWYNLGKEGKGRSCRYEKERVYKPEDTRRDFIQLCNDGFYSYVWDGIYRREFFSRNKITFDESYKYGLEDGVFDLQLAWFNPVMVTLPQIFYIHYVRRGVSTSAVHNPKIINDYYRMQKMQNDTVERLGVDKEAIKSEYIHYAITRYVLPILGNYVWPNERFNKEGILNEIKKLRDCGYGPSYLLDGDIKKVFKEHRVTDFVPVAKFSFGYYLFKNKKDYLLMRYYWMKWVKPRIKLAIKGLIGWEK